MELNVKYQELSEIVRAKTNRELTLSQIDDRSLSVGSSFKIGWINKSVSVDVTVERISGNDIHVVLADGVSMVLRGVLSHLSDFPCFSVGENGFVVHLDKVEKLRPVLEKVRIDDIRMQPDAICLKFEVKEDALA